MLSASEAVEEALGSYVVAFDCETDALFGHSAGAEERSHVLRTRMNFTVTCAVVMPLRAVLSEMSVDEAMRQVAHHTFWRDDNRPAFPVEELLNLFDGAAAIVGYNHLAFDYPLLQRFYTNFGPDGKTRGLARYYAHRAKSLDLMTRVQDVVGWRPKLDALLKENGMRPKTASGVEAVRMWEQQRRDELEEYCRVDTEQTLRLALLRDALFCDGTRVSEETFGLRPFLAARAWIKNLVLVALGGPAPTPAPTDSKTERADPLRPTV